MNKKIIYGEYTLLHWIELILRKNVKLPKYQRHFVWNDEQFYKFIASLKNGNFTPPVIIGAYNNENIILDGQQRLTSVLLAYLGYFPKPDLFKTSDLSRYVDSLDEDIDDNAEPIEWTFNVITAIEGNLSKANILANINLEKYKRVDSKYCIDDSLLNKIYIGFSYIVPEDLNMNNQQKFYSTVFRDINLQGVALQGQESRRALYYLDNELEAFFEPSESKTLKLRQNSKLVLYDFVRALAFLSQYAKDNNESSIAKKCRRQEQLEMYYENYINDVILDAESDVFAKFSNIVGKSQIENRRRLLGEALTLLSFENASFTIIDADVNYLGLIYHIYLRGKTLSTITIGDLKQQLSQKIIELKTEVGHSDSPNRVTYIRRRIKASIDVYARHIV